MKFTKKNGPIYLQIKEIIRERILSNLYPKGSNIPTENEFEKEFEVSKITIRRAIEELAKEGFLVKRSGKGTQVISNRRFSKLSIGQDFSEYLISEGAKIVKEMVSIEQFNPSEDSEIYQLFGETCFLIERRFKLNGQPYIFFRHYLPGWVNIHLEEWQEKCSIYMLLAKNGIELQSFTDKFAIEPHSQRICQLLGLKTKPILKRVRYAYNDGEVCCELAEAYYDTELQPYVVKSEV
ncbi:MAG: GntR family transcriptional regulator [Turicibacter sp.]|nr:GntR family transcriptional regulator [Turicibacter sp.]